MTGILYTLFALIDSAIYQIASALFRIIFDLASVQFFTNDQIKAITSRVYIIVGVLMLFKLVISAVQYLINPDAFEDKEKGLGGILKKTAISIGLIVIVPTVFQFLMAVQGPIIKTLPSVILGASPSETVNDGRIGFDLSFQVLSTFVRPREGKGGSVSDPAGKTQGVIHDFNSFSDHIVDGCSIWFQLVGVDGGGCHYDYKIFISTIAGAFLCYMLLGMTLDIAVRTIKMSIIQMLAPIPISSYIVNKDMLNKFVKTATTVYVDLFIRMGIVYFIIFAIQAILETGILGFGIVTGVDVGNWFRSIVVNIILIFGLLMFASKAPKFITELLGLPDIGSGDLADMFKPAWQRVGGLSAAGAAIGAWRNSREYAEDDSKKHKFPSIALRRALSAGAHATAARLRDVASGKSLEESYKSAKDTAMARTNRNLEYTNRYPNRRERHAQMWRERFDNYTGVTTGGKKASVTIEAANRGINARKQIWNRAQEKVGEHGDLYNGGTITDSWTDDKGVVHNVDMDFEKMYALFERDASEMYEGQKTKLASKYQAMKDAASLDFMAKSFAFDAGSDAQSRNEFAENILSIVRSGASKDVVGRLTTAKIELYEKDAKGNYLKDAAGNKISKGVVDVDAYDVAKRINEINEYVDTAASRGQTKEQALAALRAQGKLFTAEQAEAIAIFAKELHQVSGNVRLSATDTQTSDPTSN